MKAKDTSTDGGWFVYILRCADDSLYTGITNNLKKRLDAHASGVASKYTRSRLPVTFVAASRIMEKGSALRLEIQIKKIPKSRKITKLTSVG